MLDLLPPIDDHRKSVSSQREALDNCRFIQVFDWDEFDKVLEDLEKDFDANIEPEDKDRFYRPPLEKATINYFTETEKKKVEHCISDINKVAQSIRLKDRRKTGYIERLMGFFKRELAAVLRKSQLSGGTCFAELRDRITSKLSDPRRGSWYVEQLILYFFCTCDIFIKYPEDERRLRENPADKTRS